MSKLEELSQSVFLAKLSLGDGLQLFHNFTQVGDSIYSDNVIHSRIFIGLGKVPTTLLTPEVSILLKKPGDKEVFVPKREDSMNCGSNEDINTLTVSTTQKIKPRTFIPIPPFLVKSVNSKIMVCNGDASSVLLEVINMIKDFDTRNQDDADYSDKVALNCKTL